jgi:hypothetical protein
MEPFQNWRTVGPTIPQKLLLQERSTYAVLLSLRLLDVLLHLFDPVLQSLNSSGEKVDGVVRFAAHSKKAASLQCGSLLGYGAFLEVLCDNPALVCIICKKHRHARLSRPVPAVSQRPNVAPVACQPFLDNAQSERTISSGSSSILRSTWTDSVG